MNAFRTLVNVTVLSLGVVMSTVGCSSKPADKPGDKPAPGPAANTGAKPSDVKADFPELPAADLAKAFAEDAPAAATKYKTKAVVISGTIADKAGDPDKLDKPTQLFLTGVAGDKPLNIRCEVLVADKYSEEQFKKLKVGDTVKINGEVRDAEVSAVAGKPSEVGVFAARIVK